MKNLRLFLLVAALCTTGYSFAQQAFYGNPAAAICPGSKTVLINKQSRVPSFIVFRPDANIPVSAIFNKLRMPLKMEMADGWKVVSEKKDEVGFIHHRYQQTFNNVPVEAGEYIVHERNGRVETVNGMWMDGIAVNTNPSLTEANALQQAMSFIGATEYKWQSAAHEDFIKHFKKDPQATYFPKGELVVVCANNDIFKKEYRLAWKFDIYASQPVAHKFVYVDAQTGEIVAVKERICEIDTPATGTTYYSGTQSFTCDNFTSGQYRLRETARGQGVETYDCNNSTNTATAVDFVNSSATWTNTANDDHAANDAHWGAEQTYDYYLNTYNRNGLDDNGMLMVSYVHYDNNLNNAYWDGQSMSYGDGSGQPGGFNPLVAIDVCGHEFTHGVTQFTADLDYSYESGALNESFSDVFGTAIEFYAKPATADWLIGSEITVNSNSALRSMSNPNAFGDPDCYTGTNWYTGTADNGGVHTNSGVQNYWFYVLSIGASGTNDLGDNFNVTGLGIANAAAIAYRNLSFYLVSTSQYADARTYAIQSAQDLFGACSPEVIATTNAWYACGVGPVFSATVAASFTADITTSCSLPMTVNFTNNSTNATNATWDFGDSNTSTAYSPTHIYTQPGTYNVSLSVNSTCGADSTIQSSYIVINTPATPTSSNVSSCASTSFALNATGNGTLQWYTTPTGGSPVGTGSTFNTPVLSTTTTYYVENEVTQAPGNVGSLSLSSNGGQHNNTSTQYLEFTVYQPCTLSTAQVNAGGSGTRNFELWDNSGNLINTYSVNIPAAGIQTITLNIPLQPGSYRIGGTQMNLYRNNSNTNYPYTLANFVDITGSSAGGNYYYYLYDWTVTPAPCTSGRVPVVCTIGNLSMSFSTAGYDTVCAQDGSFTLTGGTPAGGTYSGPGVTGGVFDPAAAGSGTHTLTYTYTDTANCTGNVPATIVVEECTGVTSPDAMTGVSVYPNPANSFVTVEIQLAASQDVELNLVNMLGQSVYSSKGNQSAGTTRVNINTATLPRGVYLLQVVTPAGVQVRKVELQ